MKTITGSCHCGNIRFDLQWPDTAELIQVRACSCTFCQKHGGIWTSQRNARLIIAIDDTARVSKYKFGTKTADFHVCAACGVVPVVLCEIDDRQYAVVNVNTFDNVARDSLVVLPADFAGEASDSRLERRQRNWIPDVRFQASRPCGSGFSRD
jgi:hypothetical protein